MALYNRQDYKTALPQLEKEFNARFDGLLDFFYPVGCYFETSDTKFDPNKSWGGEWELETEGQVHISAGENYEVDGALDNTNDGGEVTHTLNKDEMPSHNHTQNQHRHFSGLYTVPDRFGAGERDAAGNYTGFSGQVAIYTDYQTPTINNTGGGLAHNNMQPYIIVNRWHRVK